MKLGGYFVNFSSARKVAQRLNIDVGEDTFQNNCRMEWPINNWLYVNGQLHIKSAMVKWPLNDGEYGIFFITKFWQESDPAPNDLMEGGNDLAVKRWLMGLGAEGMQWVSMSDRYGITMDGIHPQFSNVRYGGEVTIEEILEQVKGASRVRDRV